MGGDQYGSLKSETVKYGHKSQGTRTRERLRWQGPVAHTKDRPVLSSERAPHGIKNCHTYSVFRAEIKIWSQAPDGCFIPRQTGRLTVGRNIKLRLRLWEVTRVEAGSNTSTVTLRVVGGDKKGSIKSETVKYGRESQGDSDPRMTALARARSNCKQ
jgi:hypothetical protein